MSDTSYLFAYGLLMGKTGSFVVDGVLKTQLVPVSRATIRARLYDLGDYPGARASDDPAHRVHGTLFRLRNPGVALPVLDRFEAFHPRRPTRSEFVRQIASVSRPRLRAPVRAWVYYYNGHPLASALVPGGDYTVHIRHCEETPDSPPSRVPRQARRCPNYCLGR
jgi:gamma-glutamylcyclotransferase (GGCT)/AIG2-like uncharacterized protein YtfP